MTRVEIAKAGLYDLQTGFAALGDEAPDLIMIQSFWS
jgi:hypothetical protein